MSQEPGSASKPLWLDTVELPEHPALDADLNAEVCVIGAGMAGLNVAYQLASEGRSVIVLDDDETILSGETACTTAHISNAFDDGYAEVEKVHGAEAARLTAESHTAAIEEIARITNAEHIDAQLRRLNGYLFHAEGSPDDLLEKELAACHRAGLLDVAWTERAPFAGLDSGRCLRFPRQAQFHPLRYLVGLAEAIERHGGKIFVRTHATKIEGGKKGTSGRVETKNGHAVTAQEIVVATNTPVQDVLTVHTKQYPYRSYVIAAELPKRAVEVALYWDTADPYHYARLYEEPRRDVLIVGGEDHKTGQGEETDDRHLRLESWARERFPEMGDVVARWSGQVIEPMDALAFIGRNPGDENVWIVTGDSGDGMTHGTIAGIMLRDLVQGREHPWEKLYDPSRKSLKSALEFTKENLNMAAQYARWLTGGDVKDESEIPPGAGAVIRDGIHKVAVYRDPDGRVHRLSAVCPHLGAIVGWNAETGTWDCPAHGSRFNPEGHVVNGPANTDLSPAETEHAKLRKQG